MDPASTSPEARVGLPRPPEPPQPFRFPWLGALAPVVAAVVLWALIRSPYVLVFAALGPITAVAGWIDGRAGGRRVTRRERARFADEVEEAVKRVGEAHRAELAELEHRHPAAAECARRAGRDPDRWSSDAAGLPVRLGRADIHSALQVESPALGAEPEVAQAHRRIADAARVLSRGPAIVDARLGIALVGRGAAVDALLRSLHLQLARMLPPDGYWCDAGEGLPAMPHPTGGGSAPGRIALGALGSGEPVATVAVVARREKAPPEARIVVVLDGDGARIVQHPDRRALGTVDVEYLSAEAAERWAAVARADHRGGRTLVPDDQAFADVEQPDDAPGLACRFLVGRRGTVEVDLVSHGPHAVVAGTTGSGKSELLISWVLALASAHPPERMTVLLVDFKGGSAFAALESLPHTVGIITDLDETEASRALESLRAELRHRERALADAGARDIGETRLPRLVIVVDEFAAMVGDHPDLHAVFSDIAARGRSLGVHLVLATQRPAGVMRDALLANADLRICLRVNNSADSSGLLGTDVAARIDAGRRGRAYVVLAGGEPHEVQVALATEADAREVGGRHPAVPVRRPWLPPLPRRLRRLGPDDAQEDGVAFGMLDLPREQRRAVAVWAPVRDGHLAVLGRASCGASTALAALAAGFTGRTVRMPARPDSAWDVLETLSSDPGGDPALLLVDDLDALVPRFSDEHRSAFVDRMTALLREGPSRGLHVVVAARRPVGETGSLLAQIPARLMLAHASRQDWVLAGGESAHWLPDAPPGRGRWRGHEVQVLSAAGAPQPHHVPSATDLDAGRPLAVVTTRAGALSERWRRHPRVRLVELAQAAAAPEGIAVAGESTPIVVGDVEEWQSRWGALSALRPVAQVVFDRCTPADVRALTRSRELPPPISGDEHGWILTPDAGLQRVRTPFG